MIKLFLLWVPFQEKLVAESNFRSLSESVNCMVFFCHTLELNEREFLVFNVTFIEVQNKTGE